ncbi:uncharacterized protein YbjT (DUF2867 family) [Streptomyces phaeochromogenes]|jgi:uncharacterized protein YbjT (DUF2867 family)|nr:uncharacterized protein YbjT (DUF2867 family) [Streptomyces phaeochromogenes]
MTLLVTGARGNVGGAVLEALLAAGAPVRAMSRTPQYGQFPDTVEMVRADLTAPESFPQALRGVSKVFLYAHPVTALDFAAAARDMGVEHIVVLSSASVISASADDPIARQHRGVEEAVIASGVEWTFVRPGYFATNMLRWQSIRTDRELRTAFPDATTSPVHERDIAAIAAVCLLDDAHKGKAHAVLGAGPSTVREQVAAIAEAINEPVRVVETDVETYRAELSAKLPAFAVDLLIEARGNIPAVPAEVARDAVPDLLGRPALTVATWANDHADLFR